MLGTVVNALSIVAGTAIGILFGTFFDRQCSE